MAENNEQAALMALIQDFMAKNGMKMVKAGRGPDKKPRVMSGPVTHCKIFDRVEVKYPDGSTAVMTVCVAKARTLKLSTSGADAVKKLKMRTRVANLGKWIRVNGAAHEQK